MTHPQPKYRESVDVGQIVFSENQGSYDGKHKEMFRQSVHALYGYMRSNTFHIHSSIESPGGTYRKESALTPEGIVIHFCGNYTVGIDRVPLDMQFELISFQSPIDGVKKELTDIVKQACKKARSE